MKFSEVMFSDLNDEQLAQLSAEERALWIMRPKDPVPGARTFMYVRTALIVLAFLYFIDSGEARSLVLLLACYEFVYYNSVKEKLGLQYILDRERYIEQAREMERRPYSG